MVHIFLFSTFSLVLKLPLEVPFNLYIITSSFWQINYHLRYSPFKRKQNFRWFLFPFRVSVYALAPPLRLIMDAMLNDSHLEIPSKY